MERIVSPEDSALDENLRVNIVTFVDGSTGRTLRLPVHTNSEEDGRWRGPGAWTSDDDELEEEDLEILNSLGR